MKITIKQNDLVLLINLLDDKIQEIENFDLTKKTKKQMARLERIKEYLGLSLRLGE